MGADKRPMYGGEQHHAEHCGSQQNRQRSKQLPGPEAPEFNAKWAHFAAHVRCCPELLDRHYIVNREADYPPTRGYLGPKLDLSRFLAANALLDDELFKAVAEEKFHAAE